MSETERQQIGWWFTGSDEDLGTDNIYERFAHISDVTDEEPLNPKFAAQCVPVVIGGRNHWSDDGDLVIEKKTLFRQVGWMCEGEFHDVLPPSGPGGKTVSPVYEQIATWTEGEGWND